MPDVITDAPPPRIRKAWEVRAKGFDHPAIYYAPTAGKARIQAWRCLGDPFPDLRIVDITVRRAEYRDVTLPPRDPIADELTEEERHCLLHAYGANGDPEKAGHRDYFYTERTDPPLVSLAERKLMLPMEGDQWGKGMTYFVLTEAGKRVALSLVRTYRDA